MRTVLETCVPRKSILQGTFNPEVFTASLGPVIQYYRGEASTIDTVYTVSCRLAANFHASGSTR